MKLGTVRVRVGLSYDPLRLSPGFGDLYTANCAGMFLKQKYCHAPPSPHQQNPKPKQYKPNPKNYPDRFRGTRNIGLGDWRLILLPHSLSLFPALSHRSTFLVDIVCLWCGWYRAIINEDTYGLSTRLPFLLPPPPSFSSMIISSFHRDYAFLTATH